MDRLVNWCNLIIKKQKGLKRWQRAVTILAAMITFATTYALIFPAITVEKTGTEDVGGMYLEKTAKQDDLQPCRCRSCDEAEKKNHIMVRIKKLVP